MTTPDHSGATTRHAWSQCLASVSSFVQARSAPARVVSPADVEPVIAVPRARIVHADHRGVSVARRRLLNDAYRAAAVRVGDYDLHVASGQPAAYEVSANVPHRPSAQRAIVDPVALNANLDG